MRVSSSLRSSACLLAVLAIAACKKPSSSPSGQFPAGQGSLPAPPPAAPALPTIPGSPLPAGWIWPFDAKSIAAMFASPTVVRPIDVSRLLAYGGSGPCAPAQVAPGVWFSPDCGFTQQRRIAGSPGVPYKSLSGLPSNLPPVVDFRTNGMDGPVKYQQMVGVCWAFALSTAMDNAIRRAGRSEVVAPMHVLASSTWDDIWQKGKSDRELTLEQVWPYDPVKACKLTESKSEVWCEQAYHVQPGSWRSDPALVAEVENANRSGAFHIAKVEQLKPSDTDQLAAVLAQGQAVYLSFEYNKQAWGAIGDSNPVIPDYSAEEGGHAVVAVGYRYAGPARQFLLHNSWGPEWREGGYAWISDTMVRAHVKDAFALEVKAAANGGEVKPPPVPGPGGALPWPFPFPMPGGGAPPSSDCPAGQARDVIFGACVASCAGGVPPVAGICATGPGSGGQGTPPSGCPAGQVLDWLTRACSPQCKNGLPPVGGMCMP